MSSRIEQSVNVPGRQGRKHILVFLCLFALGILWAYIYSDRHLSLFQAAYVPNPDGAPVLWEMDLTDYVLATTGEMQSYNQPDIYGGIFFLVFSTLFYFGIYRQELAAGRYGTRTKLAMAAAGFFVLIAPGVMAQGLTILKLGRQNENYAHAHSPVKMILTGKTLYVPIELIDYRMGRQGEDRLNHFISSWELVDEMVRERDVPSEVFKGPYIELPMGMIREVAEVSGYTAKTKDVYFHQFKIGITGPGSLQGRSIGINAEPVSQAADRQRLVKALSR